VRGQCALYVALFHGSARTTRPRVRRVPSECTWPRSPGSGRCVQGVTPRTCTVTSRVSCVSVYTLRTLARFSLSLFPFLPLSLSLSLFLPLSRKWSPRALMRFHARACARASAHIPWSEGSAFLRAIRRFRARLRRTHNILEISASHRAVDLCNATSGVSYFFGGSNFATARSP